MFLYMCMQCSTSHRLEGVERYLKVGFYPFIDLLGGRIPPSTVSGSRTVGSLPLSRQQPDCEIICRTFKVPRFKAWRWESYPLATMLGGGNSSLCTHAGRWDSFYPWHGTQGVVVVLTGSRSFCRRPQRGRERQLSQSAPQVAPWVGPQ